MDLVLTAIFSIGALMAAGGALAVALVPVPTWRPVGLLAVAAGSALLLLGLSAWVAAAVALVCLLASGLVANGSAGRARPGSDAEADGRAQAQAQVGAAAAALLVITLLLIAIVGGRTGAFPSAGSSSLDPAALGRALFERDAVAVTAVGAAVLAGLAGAAAVLRGRS